MSRKRPMDQLSGAAAAESEPLPTRPRLASAAAVLAHIARATSWQSLVEVDPELPAVEQHARMRAVRNRLVRVAHPDRMPEAEQQRAAVEATANLNRLWEAACRGDEQPKPDSIGLAMAAQPLLMPPQPPVGGDVVPNGSLELLANASRVEGSMPPAMLERPELGCFVGFGNLETLQRCRFLPMATNRCISQDVVAQRVGENLQRLRTTGAYYDFGQISLVAVRQPPSEQVVVDGATGGKLARFYVLDGQHRLSAMVELARERPNTPIWFELSIKVVQDKEAANEALLHMQRCYPADPKCFFAADDEADVACRVLDLARLCWPRAFGGSHITSSRFARAARTPVRPILDDGLFFDVLRDTRLLHEVMHQTTLASGAPLLPPARPQVLFDALWAVNEAMREAGPPGKVAARTFERCEQQLSGCFLGLYRRDETGVKTIDMLRQRRVVPTEASCPLGDGEK